MTTSTEEGMRRTAVADEVGRRARVPARPLRQRLRLPLMLAGPIVVALVATAWYITGGRYVSTDDAYVQAARMLISSDISGRVVAVLVKDNQRVTAGQALFRLDDRSYRIAVEDATAQLAAARLQVDAMKASYRQKVSDSRMVEETLNYQQREFERQRQLASAGVASRQKFDEVSMAVDVSRLKLASTQNDIANMLAQLGGDPDLPAEQHPAVQRAQATLDRAMLDLSYTEVRAAEAGTVTKVEQLQVGSYVTASTPLFSLVSDRIWVEANFKETELTHMRPGQEATVEIDTYSGTVYTGKVVSMSPGTGLTFSLLPAENATGNWVKVVQRLPVRLTLEGVADHTPLHAGLSATVEVDTQFRRPLSLWLEHSLSRLFGPARAGETQH